MTALSNIINLINNQGVIGNQGQIVFNYAGIPSVVTSKDIIGNTIQDWFGQWLSANNINWTTGIHSQSWPDFILEDNSHLEVKAFDGSASPNFDLANFDAFIRSLWDGHVHRLNTPHLVFSYLSDPNNGLITINQFWVEPMWRLTGPSNTNILNLQVKQGQPINIRPKNWRSDRVQLFSSRLEFVEALAQAVERHRTNQFPNWFDVVSNHYLNVYGEAL